MPLTTQVRAPSSSAVALFGILKIAAIVALVVVAIVVGQRAAKKRREALSALAASLGMRFTPDSERDFDDWHPHHAFRRGSSRAAYNRLEGGVEIGGTTFPATMGDYRYTVQSGKSSTTYRFSFLLMVPPWPDIPDLHIRPEHWGDKLLGAIGFDDIDFESEEFSSAFMVKCPDKRFAYAVVHPRMMEYLMQVKGPTVEFKDGECLFMTGTSRWNPDEFRSRLAWAREFFGLWPDYLKSQPDGAEGTAP